MRSWDPEFSKNRVLIGRKRRQNAWVGLALAFFAYLTVVGVKGLLS